jgi:hypothetical protein
VSLFVVAVNIMILTIIAVASYVPPSIDEYSDGNDNSKVIRVDQNRSNAVMWPSKVISVARYNYFKIKQNIKKNFDFRAFSNRNFMI